MIKAKEVNLGVLFNKQSERRNIIFYCDMLDEQRVFDVVNRKTYNKSNIKPLVNMGNILEQKGYTDESGSLKARNFRERIVVYTQNIDEGKEYVKNLHRNHPELMDKKPNMQTNKIKVLAK